MAFGSRRLRPVGYRFRPSDQELVCYYLSRQIKHLAYDDDIIDCDVYGDKCPWEIFDEKKKHYVFTTLKKISKNRVARSAGVGTWHGSNSGVQIHGGTNKNKVIGLKKTFTFKVKPKFKNDDCIKNETVGNWIMYEYSLVSGENSADYVLCCIHKKKIKTSGDQEEEEEDDEDNDWDVDDDECEAVNETSVNEREAAGTAMTVMTPPDATQPVSSVGVGEYGYIDAPLCDMYLNPKRDEGLDDEFEGWNGSTETSVNKREAVTNPPDATGDVVECGMGNSLTSDDWAALEEFMMGDDELPEDEFLKSQLATKMSELERVM